MMSYRIGAGVAMLALTGITGVAQAQCLDCDRGPVYYGYVAPPPLVEVEASYYGYGPVYGYGPAYGYGPVYGYGLSDYSYGYRRPNRVLGRYVPHSGVDESRTKRFYRAIERQSQ